LILFWLLALGFFNIFVQLKTIKIIICLFGLGAILFSAAFYPIFYFQQNAVKSEMSDLIRLHGYKAFDVFNFTAQEASAIRWMDDGKEFIYKGDIYDVIEVAVKKDSCKIIALADKKEKQLFNLLAQSEDHVPVSKKSLHFIFNLISNSIPASFICTIIPNGSENHFSLFSETFYTDPVSEICAPPPECLPII
jgi:hypothetical protein